MEGNEISTTDARGGSLLFRKRPVQGKSLNGPLGGGGGVIRGNMGRT